jgi:hypothetical protein
MGWSNLLEDELDTIRSGVSHLLRLHLKGRRVNAGSVNVQYNFEPIEVVGVIRSVNNLEVYVDLDKPVTLVPLRPDAYYKPYLVTTVKITLDCAIEALEDR